MFKVTATAIIVTLVAVFFVSWFISRYFWRRRQRKNFQRHPFSYQAFNMISAYINTSGSKENLNQAHTMIVNFDQVHRKVLGGDIHEYAMDQLWSKHKGRSVLVNHVARVEERMRRKNPYNAVNVAD